MSLRAREQHVLTVIEDKLASSDPRLSSKLAAFNRLSDGAAFLAREQIRSGGHPCRQPAWPLLCLAICVALIAVALAAAHTGSTATSPAWPQW